MQNENCKVLGAGWKERIDYTLPVVYHNLGTCSRANNRKPRCDCPVRPEERTKYITRESLLEQLRPYQQNRDTGRNPKSERGAPRVKTPGRPPGNLDGFFTLDEITCDAYSTLGTDEDDATRDVVEQWFGEAIQGVS
ncbi:hypothetical protein ACFZCG_10965 [Streptomyces tanashiensis]|uniref:hypothetical protein n=1 Tax=Streptomyces tanashiensis TaxID=67367 RepID=UPI0036ED4A5A